MLDISLAEQTLIFLQSIALGIAFGIYYDILRTARIITNAKFFLTALFDVLFSVIIIIALFLFIVVIANGIVRIYIPLGVVLGTILYFFSASSIIIGGAYKLIFALKILFSTVFRVIISPFEIIFAKISKKS